MDQTLQLESIEPTGQCVLIADDDPIFRTIVCSLLTSVGFTAVPAASGREALSLVQSFDVALAIIDLDMPDGNGLDTCVALRLIPEWRGVPIIVLTSYSISQALKASLRVGANGFICKPVVPSELLQAVAEHVGRRATVNPGLQPVKKSISKPALDPASVPAESLPPAGSGWILRYPVNRPGLA